MHFRIMYGVTYIGVPPAVSTKFVRAKINHALALGVWLGLGRPAGPWFMARVVCGFICGLLSDATELEKGMEDQGMCLNFLLDLHLRK